MTTASTKVANGNPFAVGEAGHDWWEREAARVAALPTYQGALLAREAGFFRAVADRALEAMPEAVELRLFGSRASNQHRRGSDWDFLVVAPALTPERRLELGSPGRGGLADVSRVAGRAVDLEAASAGELARVGDAYLDGLLEHSLVVWSAASRVPSEDAGARGATRG